MEHLCIISGYVIQPLLDNNAWDGATSSKWPTETMRAVAVDHLDGVVQAQTLEKRIKEKAFALRNPNSN